jgi:DNA-binding transcriptional MerR regulator
MIQEQKPLPDKVYFSIGEVAKHFGVSTSLIRYWEDEFPHITPRKNGKGDRRYNKQDIEKVALIYDLIKEKRFTIKGAQAFLAEQKDKKNQILKDKKSPQTTKERLLQIREYLVQLKMELLDL